MGKTKHSFRVQVNAEYLIIFIATLGIALGSGSLLLGFGSSMGSAASLSCSFDAGINCEGLEFASSPSGTSFVVIGTDALQYPMHNVKLNLSIGNSYAQVHCMPSTVNPGQKFICFGSTSMRKPAGSTIDGKMVASASYCADPSCSGMLMSSFVGSYQSSVDAKASNLVRVVLSPPIYAPDGTESSNVMLSALGQNATISTLYLTPNGISASGEPMGINAMPLAGGCAEQLQVYFEGLLANQTVPVSPVLFNGSIYLLSGNRKSAAVALLNRTSNIAISMEGNQNQGCFFAQTKQMVMPTVSSNESNILFFNESSLTINMTGNKDNMAAFGNKILLNLQGNQDNATLYSQGANITISGNVDVAWVYGGTASITIGGNNDRVYTVGSTIKSKTVIGNNDMIISS